MNKNKITLDKLKICYLANDEVIKYLNSITYEENFHYEFKLIKIEKPGMIFDNIISIKVQNPNDLEEMIFGEICYSDKRKDENGNTYVWIEIENKVLYTPFMKDDSILVFLNCITEELNLKGNNITTFDIAFDSNTNYANKIKKAIRNKDLIPIVNRKQYLNEKEKIDGVRFNYGTNQKRLIDNTIYVKQSGKEGFFLKAYNKTKEIDEVSNNKEYIKEWLNMDKNIFRLEISLRSKNIKEFVSSNTRMQLAFGNYDKISPEMLLPYLCDSNDDLLFEMLIEHVNRLIRFKDKTTNKIISVFEL